MTELFSEHKTIWKPQLPNAKIEYYPNFWTTKEADLLFLKLERETAWAQDKITLFGKTHDQPRLTSLHGFNKEPYRYSGITMYPKPMTDTLSKILSKINTIQRFEFTSALLNLYRNGKDSNGWHADNEKELGVNPIIASVSLGAERFFHLKHNTDKEKRFKLKLKHGSLLIMGGATQHYWTHHIPKTARPIGSRINITFREIKKI